MYEFFDDPYVYGPLTQEEFDSLTVNHRMTVNANGYYIGVVSELPEYAERQINRPESITNPIAEDDQFANTVY